MKANGDEAKIAAAMINGEIPFDLAAAHKTFQTFGDSAKKMGALFPSNSQTGEQTTADPKIWANMSDFESRLDNVGNDSVVANVAVSDLDSFKAAFVKVTKDCAGCHHTYRTKTELNAH